MGQREPLDLDAIEASIVDAYRARGGERLDPALCAMPALVAEVRALRARLTETEALARDMANAVSNAARFDRDEAERRAASAAHEIEALNNLLLQEHEEVLSLRAALATQAAAVRQHDAAQAELRAADARDAATLRRREAEPGDVLRELADAREEARRWNARATELEAIVEGRTTPPTPEETLAHWKAGGWWLVLDECALLRVEIVRERTEVFRGARRIIPVDATGRPCAWPEVSRG